MGRFQPPAKVLLVAFNVQIATTQAQLATAFASRAESADYPSD